MTSKTRLDCLSAKVVIDTKPLTLYQLVHTFLFRLKLDFQLLSVSHDIDQTSSPHAFASRLILVRRVIRYNEMKRGKKTPVRMSRLSIAQYERAML